LELVDVRLPASGIHLYESKHRDGDVVREHHHQIYQILYAIEGEGQITLEGRTLDLNRDHAVVIPPYTRHTLVSSSRLTVLVLAFRKEAVDRPVQSELLDPYFNKADLIELNPFTSSEVRRLLRKMLFEQQRRDALAHLAVKIHLQEMFLLLARMNQPFRADDANSLRAEKIREYIDTHYFERLSAKDIADKLGVGIRQVNNIFKEQYGTTPMQYLAEVRIDVAKRLLIESDHDIASICFEVGYETLSTFYRTFKNIVKMSPNRYRQLQQNAEHRSESHEI
jgi:AraC family cel operon transcriptional repressor